MLFVLVAFTPALATDWHVSPEGQDGTAGSESEPLATVAHAVGRAASGDRVLLERGGTFLANDLDVGSGLSFEAYGRGALPVLTASVEVDFPGTWAQNPDVRTGAVAGRVVACFVDGRFVRLARYPNVEDGFLRIDNDDEPDRIEDQDLALRPGVAPDRWTGAQVRWRRWSWWWETRPIAGHAPVDTLDLDSAGSVDISASDPGSGYFIDNDLDELDQPGEWHWQDGTLYLYPPAWSDPPTMRVEVVTTASADLLVDHEDEPPGVVSGGASFNDIHFSRFYGTALRLEGPTTVEDCVFSEIESTAVHFTWNSQPFAIRRSVFRDVRNIAVRGWADPGAPAGSLIERNLFLRIGAEPGYGGNGPWHAAGVIVGLANQAVVRLNRFVDTGYAGIILGSEGQTVERNVFVRAMRTLNDGAAVYTNCDASTITDNIILDTIGDLEFSHPWWPMGHGIWPEFLEEFQDTVISGNTIYGSNGHGIFLPNNFSCTVSGNVVVDSRRAGLDLSVDADPNQGHTITGNTLASVAPTRRIQRPENLSHWWLPPYQEPEPMALQYEAGGDYGLMSHTTFVAPAALAAVIRKEPGSTEFDTLGEWTEVAGWASAAGSLISRSNGILLFNDTEEEAEMTVPAGAWTLPDGGSVGATVTLQPWRSAVLVTADAVASSPPYHAASGVDWRADAPTDTYLGDDRAIFADGFEGGDTAAWTSR